MDFVVAICTTMLSIVLILAGAFGAGMSYQENIMRRNAIKAGRNPNDE